MDKPLEEIQDEIIGMLHAGARIDRDAVLEAHPEHREALRRFLEVVDVIEAPPPGAEPTRLGEFTIVRELGRGGMGVVYEAEQASLRRRVALKILPPALAREARVIERFRREAEAAGRLRHPNIVPVFSVGEAAGTPFFAMELVEGESLAAIVKRRADGNDDATLPEPGASWRRWAIEIAAQIADALAYAHDEGILHRDIKPANIILSPTGAARLTDFGLALDLKAAGLTRSGEHFGTPQYMSPEQLAGRAQPVDARTDVYSLAVTLYELLTLRLPYDADTTPAMVSAVQRGEVVPPRRADPGIDPRLEKVLLRGMRLDPAERHASIRDFAADLHAVLEDRAPAPTPFRRKRVRTLARATAAALVVLGVGSWWFLRDSTPDTINDMPTAANWARLARGEFDDAEAKLLRWVKPEVRLRRYFARSRRDRGYGLNVEAALEPGGEAAPPVLVIVKWEMIRGKGDPMILSGQGDFRTQGYSWLIANHPRRSKAARRTVTGISHKYRGFKTKYRSNDQHLTHTAKIRALLLPEGFGDGSRVADFFEGRGVRATWTDERTVRIVDDFPADYPAGVTDQDVGRILANATITVAPAGDHFRARVTGLGETRLPIAAEVEATAPDGRLLGTARFVRAPSVQRETEVIPFRCQEGVDTAALAGTIRLRFRGSREVAARDSDFERFWNGTADAGARVE